MKPINLHFRLNDTIGMEADKYLFEDLDLNIYVKTKVVGDGTYRKHQVYIYNPMIYKLFDDLKDINYNNHGIIPYE
jgi:hypothetical protein